jgi:hypothetical protein
MSNVIATNTITLGIPIAYTTGSTLTIHGGAGGYTVTGVTGYNYYIFPIEKYNLISLLAKLRIKSATELLARSASINSATGNCIVSYSTVAGGTLGTATIANSGGGAGGGGGISTAGYCSVASTIPIAGKSGI